MPALHCQKCRTPLRLDGSLEDLNPAAFRILADAAPILKPSASDGPRSAAGKERRQQYAEAMNDVGHSTHKRYVAPMSKSNLHPADMSYIMLPDPQTESSVNELARHRRTNSFTKSASQPLADNTAETFLQQMEMATKLFETLSARSDIDHPVCSECTELLMEGLQQRQAHAVRERDAYVEFIKRIQQDVPTDEERAQTVKQLEDAQRQERQALEELRALEAEKARLEDEISALDTESDELVEEQETFWREKNVFMIELHSLQEQQDSLRNQLTHETKLLELLQRTNVYNDTFCIGHDGLFATINGLRLGRLPDHPVDWAEINAAWGQALLLLVVISEKLGFNFQGYKLIPLGSHSRIEKYQYPSNASGDPEPGSKPKITSLDLYGSGDLSIGLNFFNRGGR